jgi:AraC family transcriptional regulator
VEKMDIKFLEPQIRLLTDLQIHLFMNGSSVDFRKGAKSISLSVQSGQVGISPRHEWHSISFRQPISIFSIRLDDAILSEVSLELAKGMILIPSSQQIIDDGRLGHVLLALSEEQQRGFPTGELIVDTLELVIAKLLLNQYASPIVDVSLNHKLGPARLKRALDFMHANLNRKVRLKQLADCVGLSRNFFSAQFRAETGYAPHQYMTSLRIDLAKQILMTTKHSILEVGISVGFDNQHHFATVFRRIAGVTPTAYRNTTDSKATR